MARVLQIVEAAEGATRTFVVELTDTDSGAMLSRTPFEFDLATTPDENWSAMQAAMAAAYPPEAPREAKPTALADLVGRQQDIDLKGIN